jgi:hypothetical protein
MDPRDSGIDNLLRHSMAAPVPSLPPNFDQRVIRALGQNSQVRNRYRRILLTVYGAVSAITSAIVMRGQGLDWETIALTILAPLLLIAIVSAGSRPALRNFRDKLY